MSPAELLARAVARWPGLGVEQAFLARLALDGDAVAELEGVVPEDLYLCCAALAGVAAAIQEIERELAQQCSALGHFRLSRAELDDLRAGLLASLVVKAPPAAPRLARYAGRGPLGAWLRVVATREVLSWLRRQKREVVADDDALLGSLEAPAEAPELAHLKAQHRGAFSAAFRRAIAALEVRERNLLRQHYLDELSLEELAALYRVHRATAARWLAAARARLFEGTRREISTALGLPMSQIDTLIRVMQSRLDLTAGMFLAPRAADGAAPGGPASEPQRP